MSEIILNNYSAEYFLSYIFMFLMSGLMFLYMKHRQSRLYKLGNKLPGPWALPFIGNALSAIGIKTSGVVPIALMYGKKYGHVIRGWLGTRLFIFLTRAEDVEAILSSQEHIDKSSEYDLFKHWLGGGILISQGEKWRTDRKMIAPTFHMNVLKSFMPVFNAKSKDLVDQLKCEVGKTFDIHDNMSGTSVNILLETVMGINRKTEAKSGYDYAMAVMKMCDIIHQRHYKLWLRLDLTFKFTTLFKKQFELLNTIHGLTKQVIKAKKEIYLSNKASDTILIPKFNERLIKSNDHKQPEEKTATYSDDIFKHFKDDLDFNDENDIGEKKRLAFLDLLLEANQNGTNNFSDKDIKDQVNTIMFAGHDTVAASASFVLSLLGGHQNIQDRVYRELFEIFGDTNRPATFADTIQMKYLERVILESLRLFPPVPAIARHLKHDVTIKTKNYVLPANSTVVIIPYKIHRDPEVYKNPDKFDPDNFLPEYTQRRHYYSFIPFSAGPRSCIGRKYGMLKLKVLISTILRNYEIISKVPQEDCLQADIILKISDGFKINIEPRKRIINDISIVISAIRLNYYYKRLFDNSTKYYFIPFYISTKNKTVQCCFFKKELHNHSVRRLQCLFSFSTMSLVIEQEQIYQYDITRLLFYFLVIIMCGLWLLYRRQQQSRLYKLGNMIPGPPPLPLLGNSLLAFGKKPSDIMQIALKLSKKYISIGRIWIGSKLIIFLSEPDDVEVILNSHVHIDKSAEYRFFKPWLGEGLLISSGEKWRSHRKMIAPTFHINILKSFVGTFNENSKNVVEKMRSEIGKTFDVHNYMSGVTVDILLETAMGMTRNTQEQSGLDYAMAVMKMCDIIHQRHYTLWMRFDSIFKFSSFFKQQTKLLSIIHGLTNKVIKEKKQVYVDNKTKGIVPPTLEELTRPCDNDISSDGKSISDNVFKGYRDDLDFNDEYDVGIKKRLAFLDLMIESAQNGTNNITDHEIKDEVDTIMFEGHDTTAAGSSFVLSLLGIYQDVQKKVYDELYEIFGDSDRATTFGDTLKMKYLERVILESLRLYPPVPMIARKLKRDVKIITNNYVLPAGSTVVIGTYKIHRSPKYYKNPDKFDPDNFLPENTQNRHYYSFIPFSAGPRSCVGRKYAILKLKVLLSTILRNYKVVSDISEEQFILQADIILKRTDGFMIKIEPRKRIPSTA
ncbi:uncharacterized protein LOC113519550 [Galleria mellonella]|uniref:Uncharacterized protein LOC113519550 n=1 Tax=Galleria mellonella TaxID=7137 RepID=A0ABM3N3Z0_GALME|nr:uncharacterized protein LOC113519550 [Galleria mellonella]